MEGSMSNGYTSASDHLREAIRLWRDEELQEVAAFDERLSALRNRIASAEAILAMPGSLPVTPPRAVTLDANRPLAPEKLPNPVPKDWMKTLRGLSHADALIKIAEANDGVLKTVTAKQALIAANLVKGSPKNVATHLYQMLKNEERWVKYGVRWEWLAPGTYQLHRLDEAEISLSDSTSIASSLDEALEERRTHRDSNAVVNIGTEGVPVAYHTSNTG